MGLRIHTNMASLAAQRNIVLVQRETESAMKQLASGNRFADITVGSGDYAIAEHLRGQVRGMKAAKLNAETAGSFAAVAEGGLNEQNNILIRMRELAIQSASDTLSDVERGMLNVEFTQLSEEIDRIAKSTSFGSQKLLMGDSKEYEFHVGANSGEDNIIKYKSDTNTSRSSLGVDGLTVDDKSSARDALESIDEALTSIGKARANFGALISRLDSVTNYQALQIENLSDAHSKLADTDIADAYSRMVKGQALQQYQMAVLAQANQWPGNVLRLLA